ncbi:MAG: MFS transporter [Alphaproteobacteria bacterium]
MRHKPAKRAYERPSVIYVSAAEHRKVVFASSLGTVFEWYDFYLYATLAPFFASLFFPHGNETAALLSALATYAAGFLIRPVGALVFGSLGDRKGRKHAFLITVVLMGGATFAMGLLPTYDQIGWLAPLMLVLLRLTQGFALGGEYGGAATYVAEHTPAPMRGLATGWIQATATLGFLMTLLIIIVCRNMIPPEQFKAWGWRIPFMLSIFLLVLSAYIRLKLNESPLFKRLKATGKLSKAPIRESFLNAKNGWYVLLALFGATAGQAVIWYMGQFYALFFLQITLKADYDIAYKLIIMALLISTPLFVFFGWLSDMIGRKPIILAGCFLAMLTYFPIFQGLTYAVNPDLVAFQKHNPVTLSVDRTTCHAPFFISLKASPSDCDYARAYLTELGVSFHIEDTPGVGGLVSIGTETAIPISQWEEAWRSDAVFTALQMHGYPEKADPAKINLVMAVFLLTVLMIYVCMVYGPIAAFLVELFPTRIRYTSLSLPYHIGNGWFGGMLPFVSMAMVAVSGSIYYGLLYPMGVAMMTFMIGLIFLPNKRGEELPHE